MSNEPTLSDLITATNLFGDLGPECVEAIASQMREVKFSSGQLIFSRGDEGREFYLVAKGRVRLSVLTPEGRELSFAHATEGDMFGEIAMIDGGARSADATATTAVNAYVLTRTAFERLAQTHPSITQALLKFVCSRLREADQQLEAIALCPIEVRLARFFLTAARAKDPDLLENQVEVSFVMSQGELALLIGASRPKVNTAISLLESNGALKRGTKCIICNVEALEDIAESA